MVVGQAPAIPAGRAGRPLDTPVSIGGQEQPDSSKTGLLSAQMEGLRDQQFENLMLAVNIKVGIEER